ncbi:MAG: CBASS cGAMP-activated phospholipase [Planctomycetota bacterium]
MARFQILSLIGGGIRGAFVTAFLDRIEQKHGKPIAESFDLIAGTSTGGIIAAGLALGMPASQMHDFYVRYGEKIFTPRSQYKARSIYRWLYPFANWVFQKKTGSGLDSAFRARFCPHALQKSFDEGFGERTLKAVEFTRLIIPAVNLTLGRPHVFRSRHLPLGVLDQDIQISDVVIAGTAAPTYFPHRQIGDYAFVDGGVWASDPSMLAFAEAIRIQQFEQGVEGFSHCDINDIHLLSIGTGRAQFSLSPPGADAGLLYWAPRVADLMGTSQVQGIHLPLKFLLGERYRHVNFRMTEKWRLDAVENIPSLFSKGREHAENSFDMVRDQFLHHERVPFVPLNSANERVELDEFGFE